MGDSEGGEGVEGANGHVEGLDIELSMEQGWWINSTLYTYILTGTEGDGGF